MNSSHRQIVLALVLLAGARVAISFFTPESFIPALAPLRLPADRGADGEAESPIVHASPLSPFQSAPAGNDSAAVAAKRAHAVAVGSQPKATVVGEPLPSSVGAIKAQTPGGGRSAASVVPDNFVPAIPRRRLIIEPAPFVIQPGQAAPPGASAPTGELQIDLAPGVKEPIALVESTVDLPPPQARAVAAIADDFVERIEKAADTLSDDELETTWAAEQANADAQYYAIFGIEAYNRKLADTAANAIAGTLVETETPAPVK